MVKRGIFTVLRCLTACVAAYTLKCLRAGANKYNAININK